MFAGTLILSGRYIFQTSLALGILASLVAAVVIYFNLPMFLALRQFPLGIRPLPRVAMLFWLAVLKLINRPQTSLVHINNLVTGRIAVKPDEAHLLVSRCMQNSECRLDVVGDINNCRACGLCKIGAIKDLCAKRNLTVSVESGGTSARMQLKALRPKLVFAVACERELLAGILDSGQPVVGVMLQVGAKPCSDSDVKVPELERRLNNCLKGVV